MLSTKRVNTYGKRSSRIVRLSSENEPESPIKRKDVENAIVASPTSARKLLRWGRKVKVHSTSPRGSPKAGNICGRLSKKSPSKNDTNNNTPQRQPLGLKKSSIFNSPSIVYLGTRTPHSAKQTTFAPFIDSDVVKIPEKYNQPRKKSSELPRHKLTEITNVSTTEDEQPVPKPRRRKIKRVVISDSEGGNDTDDGNDSLKDTLRLPLGLRTNPILISDDDKESSPDHQPRITRPSSKKESIRKSTLFDNSRSKLHNETKLPPQRPIRRTASLRKQMAEMRITSHELHIESSLTEVEEQSVPFRDNRKSKQSSRFCENHLPSELQYLSALLGECSQEAPRDFEAFVGNFPSNEILRQRSSTDLVFKKIGEASYSEVFAIGDVVLKVVPLRNEATSRLLGDDIDLPCESDCKDVLQEIVVTRELGKICPGFIELLGTFIVAGKYPSHLLSLWDEFNERKESENIRPDILPKSQAYALLVLPNGGPDLESYKFPLKTAWRQASSVFWQTVRALAMAEESASFEHRDLHWGQILIKSTEYSVPKRRTKQPQHDVLPLDHPSYGVSATIIDMGLARMNAVDCKDKVYWTPFDDVIFEGEGDYQFDAYRMMKQVHGDGNWDNYQPITNVIWLHYLTVKVLRQKGIRAPSVRHSSSDPSEFHERRCYDSLIEMESLLGSSIMHLKGKKSRNERARPIFGNAGGVVEFARKKGWLT